MPKHKRKHQQKKIQAIAKKRGALAWSLIRSERVRSMPAFVVSCACLYAVMLALPEPFFRPLNEQVAASLGFILHALGIPITTAHDTVSDGALAFKIIPECTPLFTAGLFLSFVLFHPASVSQKAIGLGLGIPALYLGNLLRLALTFMISRYDRALFEVVHVYLGQVFTIFQVILICVVWLKWIEQDESEQGTVMQVAGFLGRFLLISGCLFLVWTGMHHWYIRFLDLCMGLGFSLFDQHVPLARQTAYYYETFSIVTFASLVLALRTVPWAMKIKGLVVGLGLLFAVHLFHRINNVLLAYFQVASAVPVDQTLLVLGQYLLPVLLFLSMLRCHRNESLMRPGKTR